MQAHKYPFASSWAKLWSWSYRELHALGLDWRGTAPPVWCNHHPAEHAFEVGRPQSDWHRWSDCPCMPFDRVVLNPQSKRIVVGEGSVRGRVRVRGGSKGNHVPYPAFHVNEVAIRTRRHCCQRHVLQWVITAHWRVGDWREGRKEGRRVQELEYM